MKLSKSKENAGQKAKKDVCFHPFILVLQEFITH